MKPCTVVILAYRVPMSKRIRSYINGTSIGPSLQVHILLFIYTTLHNIQRLLTDLSYNDTHALPLPSAWQGARTCRKQRIVNHFPCFTMRLSRIQI